jgi:hypothetical protein
MTPVANETCVEKKKVIVLGAGECPLCDLYRRRAYQSIIRCSGVDYCIEHSTAGEIYGYCRIGDNPKRSKFNQIYQQMGCELNLNY